MKGHIKLLFGDAVSDVRHPIYLSVYLYMRSVLGARTVA